MTPTWITALVSGVAALIGGLLAPTLTRFFRKRDEVLILRREWAKVLLEAFVKDVFPADNAELAPPMDLVLLDPRSSQAVTNWLIARLLERDEWTQLHDLTTPAQNADYHAVIPWWHERDRETRRRQSVRVGVAGWARGDWRWPVFRFVVLRRRAVARAMGSMERLDGARRAQSESLGG